MLTKIKEFLSNKLWRYPSASSKKKCAIIIPWYGPNLNGGAEKQATKILGILKTLGFHVDILTTCSLSHDADWGIDYHKSGRQSFINENIIRFKVDEIDIKKLEKTNRKLLDVECNDYAKVESIFPEISNQWLCNNINSKELNLYLKRNIKTYEFFILMPYLYGIIQKAIDIIGKKSWIQPCLHNEAYAYINSTRSLFVKCNGILFNSRGEQALATEIYGPLATLKGNVVGEFIDGPPNKLSLENKIGKYVLYIGKKTDEKGFNIIKNGILEFNTKNKNKLTLCTIGSGQLHEEYDFIVDLGIVTDELKFSYIKNSILVAIPGKNESFSIVMHEAWSLKKPVIVNGSCLATRLLVQYSKGGWIVNDDWYATLLEAYSDSKMCNDLGQNGYDYYNKHCSFDRIKNNYANIFIREEKNLFSSDKVFYQIIPNFGYGDAISEYCLTIRDWLNQSNVRNEILVLHYDIKYSSVTCSFGGKKFNSEDIIIYHYSIGSIITENLNAQDIKYYIVYHNITPAHYFKNYNEIVASLCDQGLSDLQSTKKNCLKYICVSEYNLNCLRKIGLSNFGRVNLPISKSKWNCQILTHLDNLLSGSHYNLIFVGRLSRSKNQVKLVQLFSKIASYIDDIKLYLIGNGSPEDKYTKEIINNINYYNLHEKVHLTYGVNKNELFTYYMNADAFVSMSEHEGVCLPLLESMLFKVPVVALNNSAISETLHDNGVLLENNTNLDEIAAKIVELLSNKSFRNLIVNKQYDYIMNYTKHDFRKSFFQELNLI